MGSYSYFQIGHLHAGDWKHYVPCEVLLMFNDEDLQYIKGRSCAYKTTALRAKRRLDSFGIDFGFCHRFYEEFANTPIPSLSPSVENQTIFNPTLPFEQYCQRILQLWRDHRSLFELHVSDRDEDIEAKIVAGSAFADKEDDIYAFATEAETLVFTRTILEMIPRRTPVKLDLTELVCDHDNGPVWLNEIMRNWRQYLIKKIAVEYQLYGFVLTNDPQMRKRISQKIAAMDENTFIDDILVPLLIRCGFERVQRINFHGAGEFGRDIMPFRKKTSFSTYDYYALQAKCIRIHGTAKASGNVAELLNQATAACSIRFMDDLDNESKRIDKFIIASNKEITAEARAILNNAIDGNRRILFMDLNRTVDMICENGLAAYVFFIEQHPEIPHK